MTRQDTERLFELLTALSINWKPKKNAALAWTLVLEPYDYETVKAAVIRLQRKSNQIPLPSEIAAEINASAPAALPAEEEEPDPPEWLRAHARYAALRKLREGAGLPPSPSMARRNGMTAMQVMEKYEEKGLVPDPIMRELGLLVPEG